MAMADLEKLFEEMEDRDLPVIVMRLHSKIYDEIDIKRDKGLRPTIETLTRIKAMCDFINELIVGVFRQNVELRTKLEIMEKHKVEYSELAGRVARKSEALRTRL